MKINKTKFKKYLPVILIAVILLVLASITFFSGGDHPLRIRKGFLENDNRLENITSINIAGQKIDVVLALTQEEQIKGLSGEPALLEGEGMLFVFDPPANHLFWMKDMNFSIDMVWINEENEIIYIQENAQPESYPELFGPDQEAKYVLEIASGFAEENKLKVGDKVSF